MRYKGIAAIVVTYNPDENLFLLIDSLKDLERVIIIDNNSKNKEIFYKIKNKNVLVIENKENFGIAKALSIGIKELSKRIKYFYTFDQDSLLDKNMIEIMDSSIEENDAIISPEIYDKNLNKITQKYKGDIPFEIVIQSGMLINLEKYKKTDGFEERLFMYYVDNDICLKMKWQGNVRIIEKAILYHKDGKLSSKIFLSKLVTFNERTETAIYYRARNSIYMIKKYGIVNIKDIIRDLILNLFYNNNKKDFLLLFFKGIMDGIKEFKSDK